jgi:hypothetical protein
LVGVLRLAIVSLKIMGNAKKRLRSALLKNGGVLNASRSRLLRIFIRGMALRNPSVSQAFLKKQKQRVFLLQNGMALIMHIAI